MILSSHTLLSSIAYCRSQKCIVCLFHKSCGYPHRGHPPWLTSVFHTRLMVNLLGIRPKCLQPAVIVVHTLWLSQAADVPLSSISINQRPEDEPADAFSTSGLYSLVLCSPDFPGCRLFTGDRNRYDYWNYSRLKGFN